MSVDPRELIARRMALQGPVYAGRPPEKRPPTASAPLAEPEAASPPERPLMLDLRFASGNRVSMSYAYLSTVEYDPSEGLTLRFMQGVVTITGSGLQPLYEAIRDHRAVTVEESSDGVFDAASDGPDRRTRIDRITIRQNSPGP